MTAPMFPAPAYGRPRRRWGWLVTGGCLIAAGAFLSGIVVTLAVMA